MPAWWKAMMPEKGITLGLDLQGGLHLVFEVEGDRAVEITTDRLAQMLRDVAKEKAVEVEIKSDGETITVLPPSETMERVIGDDYTILESVGENAYTLKPSEVTFIKANSVDQALETIRNRIDQFGVAEPNIHRQGANEIVVQLPGVKDPKRAIGIIGKTAQLEFKIVDDKSLLAAELPQAVRAGEEEEALLAEFADRIPEGDEIIFQRYEDDDTGEIFKVPFLLYKDVLLTGDMLSEARVSIDTRYNEPYVSLTFNPEGAVQ
ncbi:hypothetical protein ACFLZI_00805 [Nitrospirota bacterium]